MRLYSDSFLSGYNNGFIDVKSRVTIVGNTGADVDISDYVTSITINENVSIPVNGATVVLKIEKDDGNSISPFRDDSFQNQPQPMIDVGRDVKIYTQTNSEAENIVFDGFVSEYSVSNYSITLTLRDQLGRLQDIQLEDPTLPTPTRSYGGAMEDVIQDIINDAYADIGLVTGPVLQLPFGSPGFTIQDPNSQGAAFAPDGSVLEAINQIAALIGYAIKWRYDLSTEKFELMLYDPTRDFGGNLFTITQENIKGMAPINVSINDIRNAVRVIYFPGGVATATTESDSDSELTYRRRFMAIDQAASSQIDTAAEAETLALSALNDLKDPQSSINLVIPYMYAVQENDLVIMEPDTKIFSTNQNLVLNTITHNISGGIGTTTLGCGRNPTIGTRRWLFLQRGNL